MKENKKLVSVRLPESDYKVVLEQADFLGVSVSRLIATVIHAGLILSQSVIDKESSQSEEVDND